MAAALGTVVYQGRSGRRYAISMYLNDTTNNLARFDEAKIAVAGSSDGYTIKESGAIVDVCLTSDVATPTHIQIQRNGQPTGDILDCTAQLASVVNRPAIMCPLAAGDKLQIMQIA